MTYSSKNFLFFLFLINFIFNFPILSHSRQFLERDHIIIDLKSGIEWLRCSTGQTWNGKECEGEVVRLSFEEIQDALKQANEQLGGGWRLPTKIELEGIVCQKCKRGNKIDNEFFPSTPAEPFWTSDKNKWSSNRFWTVNFFTGYSFSRFTASKPLASRFVKDR